MSAHYQPARRGMPTARQQTLTTVRRGARRGRAACRSALALRRREPRLPGAPARARGLSRADDRGFTPEQQFFLGWAQFRSDEIRPETQRSMVQGDPHPIAKFRVIGPFSNMPEFARAFSRRPGAPMVREPAERCRSGDIRGRCPGSPGDLNCSAAPVTLSGDRAGDQAVPLSRPYLRR
jgi:hypothetical protein